MDLIPPSKIKDLKVTEQDFYKGTIAFSFTAPGDDGDFGHSKLYIYILKIIKKAFVKLHLHFNVI